MAKTPMRCPFNEKLCTECEVYRGRHYYMCTCKHYRGYIEPKTKVMIDNKLKTVDLEAMRKLLEPWSVIHNKTKKREPILKIKLKVIDMENGKERFCEHSEAKTWGWGDPNIMRLVNGTHVTSWNKLFEMMQYYEERGTAELVIYEAPGFMLLGGG